MRTQITLSRSRRHASRPRGGRQRWRCGGTPSQVLVQEVNQFELSLQILQADSVGELGRREAGSGGAVLCYASLGVELGSIALLDGRPGPVRRREDVALEESVERLGAVGSVSRCVVKQLLERVVVVNDQLVTVALRPQVLVLLSARLPSQRDLVVGILSQLSHAFVESLLHQVDLLEVIHGLGAEVARASLGFPLLLLGDHGFDDVFGVKSSANAGGRLEPAERQAPLQLQDVEDVTCFGPPRRRLLLPGFPRRSLWIGWHGVRPVTLGNLFDVVVDVRERSPQQHLREEPHELAVPYGAVRLYLVADHQLDHPGRLVTLRDYALACHELRKFRDRRLQRLRGVDLPPPKLQDFHQLRHPLIGKAQLQALPLLLELLRHQRSHQLLDRLRFRRAVLNKCIRIGPEVHPVGLLLLPLPFLLKPRLLPPIDTLIFPSPLFDVLAVSLVAQPRQDAVPLLLELQSEVHLLAPLRLRLEFLLLGGLVLHSLLADDDESPHDFSEDVVAAAWPVGLLELSIIQLALLHQAQLAGWVDVLAVQDGLLILHVLAEGPVVLADVREKGVEEEDTNGVVLVDADLVEVAGVGATQGLHVFLLEGLGVALLLILELALRFLGATRYWAASRGSPSPR